MCTDLNVHSNDVILTCCFLQKIMNRLLGKIEGEEWYHTTDFIPGFLTHDNNLATARNLMKFLHAVQLIKLYNITNFIQWFAFHYGSKTHGMKSEVQYVQTVVTPFYIVSYFIKCVTTSWTYNMILHNINIFGHTVC